MEQKCTISIANTTTDGTGEFFAEGSLESVGTRRRVRYLVEGDEGELVFTEETLSMTRTGNVCLSAQYAQDADTVLRISTEGVGSEIAISTDFYRLSQTEKRFFIELQYNLVFTSHKTSQEILKIPYCLKINITLEGE